MFIKGKGRIVIGRTTTTTTTTGIQIRIEGKGEGEGNSPVSKPGKFPLSLPKNKPVPNGLPAHASGNNKNSISAMIPSVPFGQGKK